MSIPITPNSTQYSSTYVGYKVKFVVDGDENTYLESCFRKCRIQNTLSSGYPNIFLEFLIDNEVIITQNLYPQCNIDFYVYYTSDDQTSTVYEKPLIFNLVLLEMTVPLPQKYRYNISTPQKSEKQTINFICVPKQALEVMNFTVNKMWDSPRTVADIVMDVINYVGMTSKVVDQENMNKTLVDQFLIPPMSFRNTLRYIDDKFGIYKHKLFFNMNYNGTFVMHDLKKKFDDNKGGLYTVYKLPEYTKTEDAFEVPAQKEGSTHTNFVTYDWMHTICKSNDVMIPPGFKQLYFFHNDKDIVSMYENNMKKLVEKCGIHSDTIDIKINQKVLEKRIVVYDDKMGASSGGYEELVDANMSDPAFGMNALKFKLYRKIKPHILMQIGIPFNLKVFAQSEQYPGSDYSGTYLVTKSILAFSRIPPTDPNDGSDTIRVECEITSVRTSQSHLAPGQMSGGNNDETDEVSAPKQSDPEEKKTQLAAIKSSLISGGALNAYWQQEKKNKEALMKSATADAPAYNAYLKQEATKSTKKTQGVKVAGEFVGDKLTDKQIATIKLAESMGNDIDSMYGSEIAKMYKEATAASAKKDFESRF